MCSFLKVIMIIFECEKLIFIKYVIYWVKITRKPEVIVVPD